MSKKGIKILLLVLCFLQFIAKAQDLSNIGHQKPISISGSLGLRLTEYRSNLENPYYPNSSYIFTGAPVLSIYGYAIPLSFMWTNQQTGVLGQPFNQFGISPTYHHITFQVGYRNISYSKYAMAGYQLFGIGAEYEKGDWKISACYGRLKKMELIGIDTSGSLPPYTYKRNAVAGLVRYGNTKRFIALNFLKGMDNPNSVPTNAKTQALNEALVTNIPTPAHNLVLDLQCKLPLFLKGLTLENESAISYYTNDVTTPLATDSALKKSIPLWGIVSNLTKLNATSQYYTASNSKLNYANKHGFNTYLQYTRIDPNYQSMGLNYMQGDIQNILVGMGVSVFHSTIRLGGSIGRQNDNLNNASVASSVRWIGSGNASYSGKHFGMDLTYYNFSSDQTPTVSRFADSLRITQSTNTLNCSPRYYFSTKGSSHTICLTLGLNTSLDLNNSLSDTGQQRKLYTETAGLNYCLSIKKNDLSINTGIIFTNLTDHAGYAYKSIGANFGANKSILSKKVKLGLNGGIFETLQDSSTTVNHTVSFNGGYALTKKFHTDLIIMYNDAPGVSAITNLPRGTKEVRLELNLTYTF